MVAWRTVAGAEARLTLLTFIGPAKAVPLFQSLRSWVYVSFSARISVLAPSQLPTPFQVEVLQRDGYKCVRCGWSRAMLSRDDPRKMLELHHVKHHIDKGENTTENLITLCNVHHDEEHRQNKG
jgi:hypothetical protein